MTVTIDGINWIDNKPIREAVEEAEREGLSANEIALRLGWRAGKDRSDGDGTRLGRRLGRILCEGHVSRALRYDLAVAIVRAIGRDPIDLDL